MDSQRWQKIQTLFSAAVALPADERAAFLEEECAGDTALREDVERLLYADSGGHGITEVVRDAVADLDKGLEGTVIGHYRLLGRIGSGGMGSVFQAERADGTFEKTVAIKIVKKGMDTENVVGRFQVEQKILARLDHPNIASILDGGITDDGRPYFVMEYVPGVPITTYCDTNRLAIHHRLRLFRKVCEAVHHAHKSLVVHRDLKPSNILVTENGELKLLDFGIAKLLDEEDEQQLTRTGLQVLTPAYASPEQLLGQQVTTATDVYALGIILYELMAGRRPFEIKRTAAEMRDQVISADVLKPSTAITRIPLAERGPQQDKISAEIGAARATHVGQLRKNLKGDLDNICLMALRREPERRYASAEQMGTDIERHLNGLTVIAMPDSVNYRIGKFVRRHSASVIASAAVVAAFIAMASFYTVQLANERDVALQEKAKAEQIVGFVQSLFRIADPEESLGEDLTAREILDAGADRIRTELVDRPAVRASIMQVLGQVYYQLALYDKGAELMNESLATQRALANGPDLDVATAELSLAMLYQSTGDLELAKPLFDSALSQRIALHGAVHRDVLEALSGKAFFEETLGNYNEAEDLHEQALAMARQLYDSDDTYLAEAMTKTAAIYRIQDKNDVAEPLLRESLAMQQRLYGPEHPKVAETQRQLAGLLRNTRRFEEAEAMYEALIESRTRMLGENHTEVAHTWGSYSQLLSDMGDTEGAIAANQKLIEITTLLHDGVHPSLAAAFNNHAFLERDSGNLDNALIYFQKSIDMQDATGIPPRHPNRSFPISGLADIYQLQGNAGRAVTLYREALALRLETFATDHLLVWELRSSLGDALVDTGEYAESEALLIESHAWFQNNRGAEDPRTRSAARSLAKLYERTEQTEKRAQYLDKT